MFDSFHWGAPGLTLQVLTRAGQQSHSLKYFQSSPVSKWFASRGFFSKEDDGPFMKTTEIDLNQHTSYQYGTVQVISGIDK